MNELGQVLRAWRERLTPEAVGIPHHSPRRVPGLRRGELAMLAGISTEYVERLEQGRSLTPSPQVCTALARVLQLSDGEQAHLMRLAGHAAGPDRIPLLIPANLHRLMEQLAVNPLAVYSAAWQLLHWNPLFAATFGDPTSTDDDGRNLILSQFRTGTGRMRLTKDERDAFEGSLVSDLRASTSRYPSDPSLAALVRKLRRLPRFLSLWAQPTVGDLQSARKIVEHPLVGEIALETSVLTIQPADLRLVVFLPRPDTDARSKLDLAATVGLQQWV